MNHIQHFGAGAFVATFAIFAASAIDTNAQYFAVENSNAIYAHGASVALAEMSKATDGKRSVDTFAPSVKTSATNRRMIEVRGTVTSVTDGKIVVTVNGKEWTGIVTNETKFPIAHGNAVQMKPEMPPLAQGSLATSTMPQTPPPTASTTDNTQPGVMAPVTVAAGTRTIRLSMVRDFDVRSDDGKQGNAMPTNLTNVSPKKGADMKSGTTGTAGGATSVGTRSKIHPTPMPMPIVPVDGAKPIPGTAQPVPVPRD
jgi:hypothetical protein